MPDWRGCGPLDLEDWEHLQRCQQRWPEHDQIQSGRKCTNRAESWYLWKSARDLHLLRRLQSGRRLKPFTFTDADTDFRATDFRATDFRTNADLRAAADPADKRRLLQVRSRLR